jgi:hypothetical protein
MHRNLEQVIIGAYRWLSDNYKPGDQIFFFGNRLFGLSSVSTVAELHCLRLFPWRLPSPSFGRYDPHST